VKRIQNMSTYYETLESETGELQADEYLPVESRVSPLLVGVAVLTIFFVPQMLQMFPSLAGLQIVKVTAIAVTLLFLLSRRYILSRVRLGEVKQVACLIALLVLATITIPLAVWPNSAFHYIFDVYGKNVIFVYLLVQAARSDRDVRVIVTVLTACCAALVLAMITGFGPLVTYQSEPGRLAVGGTYDPNDLGLLFVITIPFAFFMIRRSGRLMRLFLLSSIALMLIGMVKTGSRGGFLGLLAISVLMFVRASSRARKYTLAAAALGSLLLVWAAPAAYWARINTIFEYREDYNLTMRGGRIQIWEMGMKMIASSPLTGVGISCFPYEHSKLSGDGLQKAAHNIFVQAAAELGLPGLLLFVSMIFISLRQARTIRRQARGLVREEFMWLASAVEISMIGFVVSGFFLSHAYSGISCFMVGIAGVLHTRYLRAREADLPDEEVEYA
jgi:putative inorganic carbon (HCO3(-)) transporter